MSLDRIADRPPHLDDGKAALEQFLGLVRQDVAQSLRAGPLGVVVMRPLHRLPDFALLAYGVVGGAQRVIEHHDAVGAALGFDQLDYFRVIDPLDLVDVHEVLHLCFVPRVVEAVHVEIELAEVRAGVVHHHLVRIGRAAVLQLRGAGAADVVEDLGAVVDDVVDRRLDGQRRGVGFGESGHGCLRLISPPAN